MSGEPQYVGIESPKQIYGAWFADATVVLFLSDIFLRVDPLFLIFQKHPGVLGPVFLVVWFVFAMFINGAVLRGATGGSVGDHIFRIARVNQRTWAPLGIIHAARYSLAPVYEIFFHARAEQSRFRKPATVIARHFIGHHPNGTSKANP